MQRLRDVRATSGLAPEPGRWYTSLEDLRVQTLLLVHGLEPGPIAWVPGPGCNSIGTLLTHLAESEAFWIVERIGGRPLPAARRELYRMDRFGLAGTGQAPLAPASFFARMLADLRLECREILAGLSDADLDGMRVWVDPDLPRTQEIFTVRWILRHVLEHEAHHKGQIAMIRRLLGAPPAPTLSGSDVEEGEA